MAHGVDVARVGHRRDDRLTIARRRGQNLMLFCRTRVINHHVEHETIELRLWQRIRSFLLDRVLRREHEQRPLELVANAVDRHLILLHRLEQRRLRLWRRAVDLVGEDHVRENRPGNEANLTAAGGAVLFDYLGADDVRGHQVRRELDAVEFQVDRLRERLDQEGLGEARHAA